MNSLRQPSWLASGVSRWAVPAALLLVAGLAVLDTGRAAAQTTPADANKTYMNKPIIVLPIVINPRKRAELSEVQLFVKEQPDQRWFRADRAKPNQKDFQYRATHDGEYWFTVVTVDHHGRLSPPDLTQQPPQAVVVIDREQPRVHLRRVPSADGKCVECEMEDANPNMMALEFEYQTRDNMWRKLDAKSGQPGTFCIPSQAAVTGMIRVTARDRCKNVTTRQLHLDDCRDATHVVRQPAPATPSGLKRMDYKQEVALPKGAQAQKPTVVHPHHQVPAQQKPAPNLVQVQHPVTPPAPVQHNPVTPVQQNPALLPTQPAAVQQPLQTQPATSGPPQARKVVNHHRVVLNYQIAKTGTSGVGRVEIWATENHGKTWKILAQDPDRTSPAEVFLPGEGEFGLKLVVKNGFGLGIAPPQTGDQPDWVVEVDRMQPQAQVLAVEPIKGQQAGAVMVRWVAADKNFGSRPISLYYGPTPTGPWEMIAVNLQNTGQHHWLVPQKMRSGVFVRLVATDEAGNTVATQTPTPTQVDDGSRPIGTIGSIQAASGQ